MNAAATPASTPASTPRPRPVLAPIRHRPVPSAFSRPRPRPEAKFEREPSDMAKELLVRVIAGLSRVVTLSARDEMILAQVLYGRSAELAGKQLGLRETTVHKHLHRIYAKTQTSSRRELLHLGRDLANARLRAVA